MLWVCDFLFLLFFENSFKLSDWIVGGDVACIQLRSFRFVLLFEPV